MAINSAQKIWTHTITDTSYEITQDLNLVEVSFYLLSGAGTFTGDDYVGGVASSAIALVVGVPISLEGHSLSPLEGITLDCSGGGVIHIIGKR